MPSSLSGRNLLSMRDLSAGEIESILALAIRQKGDRAGLERTAPLSGKTLAMIFQKPSLRTRVSFETGMTRLGGHAIYLSPTDISLGKRETTEDIARVLARYADAIMARVFGHDIVEELARHAGVPVINGLSDFEHPCQILADFQTVLERKGKLKGLRGCYVGDGNNVANSLAFGAARVGMHFTVASPPGYELRADVLEQAQQMGRETGAEIRATQRPSDAARDADWVYTDVWASMGQESEAAQRREHFKGYQVNAALMSHARPDAIVLHCLPAHYGEEIDYAVTRTANSAIFDQAENRMHAQNALLTLLLTPRGPRGAAKRPLEP